MADTRYVQMQGEGVYVKLSLDDAGLFSATNDSSREVRVHRTMADVQPDIEISPGRPVESDGIIERQLPGFYWVAGVGRIGVDDE